MRGPRSAVTAPRDVGARWREAREREDEQLDVLRDAEQMWGSTNDFRCLERARDEEGNLAAARRATDEALIEAVLEWIQAASGDTKSAYDKPLAAAILGELEKNA